MRADLQGMEKPRALNNQTQSSCSSHHRRGGEWPAVGKEDIYLTHKPSVMKARKEKMIITLADEPL